MIHIIALHAAWLKTVQRIRLHKNYRDYFWTVMGDNLKPDNPTAQELAVYNEREEQRLVNATKGAIVGAIPGLLGVLAGRAANVRGTWTGLNDKEGPPLAETINKKFTATYSGDSQSPNFIGAQPNSRNDNVVTITNESGAGGQESRGDKVNVSGPQAVPNYIATSNGEIGSTEGLGPRKLVALQRELQVVELTGGRSAQKSRLDANGELIVEDTPIYRDGQIVSGIDVIGKNGELIQVGGPGKNANDAVFARTKNALEALREPLNKSVFGVAGQT